MGVSLPPITFAENDIGVGCCAVDGATLTGASFASPNCMAVLLATLLPKLANDVVLKAFVSLVFDCVTLKADEVLTNEEELSPNTRLLLLGAEEVGSINVCCC